ncbi:hypothetical protein GLAREA_11869 [Glarea lozoyensis ATCC 20868]|uniref:Uncharacterized protein n=1 Tax=Glarea lozoyensis (strain ATCC 20868 / MF5171) TaxID=1116229 RepID=S3CZW3_GLAL2|nr:uncharacterized protein GLAREA_11869 [Glarea lozoyensis ATCC 20868]EPE31787.1 hypothetical protein GLAREA_11869 [Glarea lozoyensis ATCC 20868]
MDDEWTRHFDKSTQSWALVNKSTGEFKYEDSPPSPEKSSNSVEDPDEYRKVFIFRSAGGNPAFKHWILFIAPYPSTTKLGTVLNIEGRRTHYR